MYKIQEKVIRDYDFNVSKMSKMREVFMLNTNKGFKCLKK